MENYFLGYNETENFKTKFIKLVKQRRFGELFTRGRIFIKQRIIREKIGFFFYKLKNKDKKFNFNGKSYNYLVNNKTYYNERMVEVPIFKKILNENKEKRILEVGNVMHNFTKINHDVLDKYEVYKGVINKDIIDYKPANKYDLIISVSTLEHVGWDETPKNPKNFLDALENLKNITKENGKIIFSIPWNYNLFLDKQFKNKKIKLKKVYFLKRNNRNSWKQVNFDEIKKTKFNFKIPRANSLLICEL